MMAIMSPATLRTALARHPVDLHRLLEGARAEGMRIYHSRAATQQRLNDLMTTMRHELLTINPERTFEPKTLATVAAFSHEIAKRGIRQREICTGDFRLDSLVPYGGLALAQDQLRHMTEIPIKVIIVDREVAFVPLDARNHERGYVEVSSPILIQSMVSIFERCWDQAGEFSAAPSLELTARERAVVGMLLHGRTDAATARALRLSERSITNVVRSLMDRVGANNRFQLGVALGSLGAVPPPPVRHFPGGGGGGTED
jgi:DNA-binding CsgD family transcriptional regulator